METKAERTVEGKALPQDEIHRPNVDKLTAFINLQDQPERFARLLFSICKPSAESFTNREKKA